MIYIFNNIFDSCMVFCGLLIIKLGNLTDNDKGSPSDDTDKVSALMNYENY